MKRKSNFRKGVKFLFIFLIVVLTAGFLLPERLIIPVRGATPADWNHSSFWYRPWGKSGVHRGIDIFAREGCEVVASCSGIVISAGNTPDGGNVVAVLGPKWRVHYYAHLGDIKAWSGRFVAQGEVIGTVGTTGNAAGKPPHLHYAIITQIPYPWRYRPERFGIDRMLYLNPHELLMERKAGDVIRRGNPQRRFILHLLPDTYHGKAAVHGLLHGKEATWREHSPIS
jgi:murein DD-endopeptidase MepM/ murein hydrolase activator NlpD